MRATSIVVGVILVLTCASAQSETNQGSQDPAFEVASIRPNRSGDGFQSMQPLPDRFVATNMPLATLLTQAYRVRVENILNAPAWVAIERFDINAKIAEADARGTREEMTMRRRLMLRTLFRDRFRLVVREVSIDKDGFALVVARGDGRLGPQLQRSTLTCVGTGTPPVLPRTEVRSGQPVLPPGVKPECRISDDSRGNIIGRGMPIESLAVFLRGVEGRIVIDKTELEGRYDFELSFAPDGPLGATAPDATRSYRSSIVTAVVEQLGLRLEPYKVAEPGIYIEHIERPSPN